MIESTDKINNSIFYLTYWPTLLSHFRQWRNKKQLQYVNKRGLMLHDCNQPLWLQVASNQAAYPLLFEFFNTAKRLFTTNMSVCDHISRTTLSSFTKFLYLSLSVVTATARSSCPAALRYAMYFRVYGWRHIYTQPGDSTEDSMYLTLWHTLKLTHKGLAPYWGQSDIYDCIEKGL